MDATHYLNWMELSQSALDQNIKALARLAGKRRMMSVCVKANAYGHGLTSVVQMLLGRQDVEYLTVHSLDEAIECRVAGWRKKIMLLGPAPLAALEAVVAHDIEPVVFTRETLLKLGSISNRLKKDVRTHLKLETGTNRQGVTEKQLPQLAKIYKKYPHLKKPYGASMHFANIEDTTNHAYAQEQLDRFRKLVQHMTRLGIKPTVRHTASSAAMILFDKTRFELVRPGIAVYGHWPSKETYLSYRLEGGKNGILTPVLTWKSRVIQIKDIPTNSFIGYGCTYRTTSPTRLAILPVGYADGFARGLSNVAYVLIKGRRAPIRGRICMNLAMADITDIPGVKLEDPVVLIGSQGKETLTAEQLAQWSGTINYEVLARLSPAMPRLVTA
jgi:alanine racemase